MNYSDYRFTLDIQIHQAQVSVPVTLNDTARKLYIGLTDGRKPYTINDGCRAVFAAKKPDGTTILNDCIIEKNTTIVYEFSKNTTSAEGIVNCEVRLFDAEGKELTSPQFLIVVDAKVVRDEEVSISESESTTISNLLIAERGRVAAEEVRASDELAREEAEIKRSEAEDTRKAAEIERVGAEFERYNSETARANAENLRVEAENARADAENSRAGAEDARKEADEKRNKLVGDIDEALDEILKVQNHILGGNAEIIAKEEVIKAINENMLIANDLVTNDPYKALSAAQGVALKSLADSATKTVSGWYNGTDSKILELVFPFAPKFVFIAGMYNYDRDEDSRAVGRDFGIILPQESFMLRQTGGNTDIDHVSEGAPYILLDGTTVTLDASKIVTTDYSIIFNQFSYAGSYTSSPATRETIYGYRYFAIG